MHKAKILIYCIQSQLPPARTKKRLSITCIITVYLLLGVFLYKVMQIKILKENLLWPAILRSPQSSTN